MTSFKDRVLNFINKIPKGKVVSYGQVAAVAGSPRAARQVGAILKTLDVTSVLTPWWRVINNQGIISVKGSWTVSKELQKKLLLKEGIEVNKNFIINIEKYRWKEKKYDK